MLLIQLLIIVTTCTFCANGKLCQDVSVRNEISSFEKHLRGCSVIHGNLEVALIEDETMDDFSGVSFPELIEIRGFFLIYRVYGLTTLSGLFPNLTIIRGLNLFRGYSFIFFDLTDLREIGLPKLQYIVRGSTRIEMCPQICYIDTVNWTSVGHSSHKVEHFNINKEACGTCPDNCKGLCWGKFHCQETAPDNCHPECVGCTKPNFADKCIQCRNFKDNGKCVAECPEGKYRHPMLVSCLTEDECFNNPLRGTWWTFQGECIKRCPAQHNKIQKNNRLDCEFCGDDCRKVCDGIEVDSKTLSDELHGCTHIIGSLSIRTESKMRTAELSTNLEMIEEIDGYLKIHRSAPLTSLEFLKKLRIIHGNELHKKKYALIAFENQNLHTLWAPNHIVKMNGGTLFFHDNTKLCLSKIKEFAEVSNLTYTEFDVSPHSNGNHRTCNYIDLNIIVNLNSTNVTLVWENVTATGNLSDPVGYWLSYTEDSHGNISISDRDEECYENIWESVFIADNTTYQILHLNPFTQYAYYIRLYTNLSDHEGQTRIRYFKTLSDNPSELINFNAISTSSDSVTLNWKHPLVPSGRLGRYELVVYYERDDQMFLSQRNFCKHPHYGYVSTIANASADACCKNQHQHPIPNDEFEFTCDSLNIFLNEDATPGGCKDYMYSVEENTDPNELVINSNAEFVPAMLVSAHRVVKRSFYPTDSSDRIEMQIEDVNLTTYVVKPLKHFSMFAFVLKVCHNWSKSKCSSPVMTFQRTLPKEEADDIPPSLSMRLWSSTAIVSWHEPRAPNSMIVSYQIEHKRTDLENSITKTECITRNDFISSNHVFRIKKLVSGHYAVRVKAVSLAGPGKFSEYLNFEVPKPPRSPISWITIVLGILAVVVLLVIVMFNYRYYCYRRRHNMDHDILLHPLNDPEDDWEMDRKDVQLDNVLTRGSFTTTYIGRIISQNRPCIIKSTTQPSIRDKTTFLNQVNTMKVFNGPHHVMRLLGIVSHAELPLALMEVADRGDLKAYLRQLKAAHINTTADDLYRMAVQIADGMFYLATQRYIHRDLAARNCMVCADYTVKVGDYGVSKDVYRGDYHLTETGGLKPVRWMAPESLTIQAFTTDSDVWSYGILLWELVTFAEQPYEGVPNHLISDFIASEATLERPDQCPDILYEIMKVCWKWNPNDRPQFMEIVERFERRMGQQFSLVSFFHSREGERYRRSGRIRFYNQPSPSRPQGRSSGVRWSELRDEY